MTHRTVTAVFADRAAAEAATHALATRIGGVRGHLFDKDAAGIGALGLPEQDVSGYREAVRRGQTVLSAQVPADRFDAVAQVLEDSGAIDFEQQEASWRQAGWQATPAAAAAAPTRPAPTRPAAPMAAAPAASRGEQESIPLAEERLRIGKRETRHGRVHLRSYVVETPVEEQVTLREERVQVERRPVDRAATAGDRLFEERSIDATETAEEAVVQKDVRVTGEVPLRKEVGQRTETVRDTVRRTEVKVDDDRRSGRPAGEPAADTPAPRVSDKTGTGEDTDPHGQGVIPTPTPKTGPARGA